MPKKCKESIRENSKNRLTLFILKLLLKQLKGEYSR